MQAKLVSTLKGTWEDACTKITNPKLVSKATKVPTLLKIEGSILTPEEVQDANVTSFSAKAIVLNKK